MKFRLAILVALKVIVALGALGLGYMALRDRPRPVRFDTFGELQELADSNGLYWHSGRHDSQPALALYISDRPLTVPEIARLCAADAGQTPAWRGIVWITHQATPEKLDGFGAAREVGGEPRVWGKLLVAGDVELMDRIEQIYRNR